jgi:hypothetical protein
MPETHPDPTTGSDSAAAPKVPASEAPRHEPSILSQRALVARDALLAAALLGITADPLLRNGPWGIGLLIWMLQFAAIVAALVRRDGRPLSREGSIWLGAAVFFAGGLSWRDSGLLHFFDVLAMLSSLVLLAMSMNAIPVPGLVAARVRDLIRGAFGTGISVAAGAVPLLLHDAELHTAPRQPNTGRVRQIGRALLIAAPIFIVFALLLSSADPVFGSLVTLPDFRVDVALSHVIIAGFFAWVTAGWLRRALLAPPASADAPATPLPFTVGATDVTFALGALNALFAAFVIVQIGWLFGGEALVLRTTGLGYAEYARRGFFELMWVAGLLLPVLLGAHALIPDSDSRTLRLYRRLAIPLVVLLGAILVSAGARMKLYVHYYGISTDRLYASAVMIWLAIVFAWLVFTVLRSRPRTFATGFVASAFAVLFALNVLNPDALVARSNLARDAAAPAKAAGTDLRYVATLGGDAIPMVVSALTAPGGAGDNAAASDRCTAAATLLHRWSEEGRAGQYQSWTQWNVARSRAMRAVNAHESELRQLACAKTTTEVIAVPASP